MAQRVYRNWQVLKVNASTSGTVSLFTNKSGNDYRIYKEGKAPSNADVLIHKITIERATGTDKTLLEKALNGAIVIVKGQRGQERVLGHAKFITPELNPFTDEDTYMLEAPILIPAGGFYEVIIRWDEKPKLGENEEAEIVIRIDGVEIDKTEG